jgi:hypothetical protein
MRHSSVRDEQDTVDLVHLDELHLDALAARGRKVLADVVGADRELAVAAVDEDGELDAVGRPYSKSVSIAARIVRPCRGRRRRGRTSCPRAGSRASSP